MSVSKGRRSRIWNSKNPFKDLESGNIIRPVATKGLMTCKTMGFILLLGVTSISITLLTIYHRITWNMCFIIYGCIAAFFLFIYK